MQRLLDALTAMDLVEKHLPSEGNEDGTQEKQDGPAFTYSNTQVAKDFLLDTSPTSCLGYVQHSNLLLYPMWGDLEVGQGYRDLQSLLESYESSLLSDCLI
jgi:hypothetical protein